MKSGILALSASELEAVASALRAHRLKAPYSTMAIQRFVSAETAAAVARDLQEYHDAGLTTEHLATVIELVVRDRQTRPELNEVLEVVATGPDTAGVSHRDTSVVVRDLFANANKSVLLAGYAVHQGQSVFQVLADRMLALPALSVRMFLDIQRPPGDLSHSSEIIARFANRFRNQQWPKDRPMPAVFFHPTSLDQAADKRACLHAKCIVVDEQSLFVSSANFTEAAQLRNVELGILVHSPATAARVVAYFESLLAAGHLTRHPGIK